MKALAAKFSRNSSSGLPDAAREDAFYDPDEEEVVGQWFYLVTDKDGMTARRIAAYDKSHKVDGHYNQGSVVEICKRLKRGWTTWLCVKQSLEWVFDVSPKDKKVRLVEVSHDEGIWQYEAAAPVSIVSRPTLAAPRKGAQIARGEIVKVMERVRPMSSQVSYLRLSDGRGWVSDLEDRQQVMLLRDGSLADVLPGADVSRQSGQWSYMVVDPNGVQLRQAPAANAPKSRRLEEGEIVSVGERSPGGGVVFLKLADGAWGFDVHPDQKVQRISMMEVTVERGSFVYRVVAPKGVGLRARASFGESAKATRGPDCGATIHCSERVKCGETAFLKLADGRGWVFDKKNGKQILEFVSQEAQQPSMGGYPSATAAPRRDQAQAAAELGDEFQLEMS